jgi:signal transduction histidine kinase
VTEAADGGATGSRRWLRYVGPWPLRPWTVGPVVGGLVFVASSSHVPGNIVRNFLEVIPSAMVPGIGTTIGVTGVLLLASRILQGRQVRGLGTYLLIVALASVVGSVLSVGAEVAVGLVSTEQIGLLPVRVTRLTLWILLVLALVGTTAERLSRQTRLAERSLDELREQQSLMLIHEERSRRQFAMLLHDRVQAGLMTACLELKVATSSDDVDKERIAAVVSRIDDIRGLDVHRAARAMSPDIANMGLKGALQELVRIYEPGLRTSIHLAPGAAYADPPLAANVLLACYRIVEQGVLNAVVHGHATECFVVVSVETDDTLVVEVSDNGRGASDSENVRGFGSAVLDSWCRVLNGSWTLDFPPGGGARLRATLSLEPAVDFDVSQGDMSLQ